MSPMHPPARMKNVLPLVGSIVAEISERRAALRLIERSLDLATATAAGLERQRLLCAELATHRCALRGAKRELERLGCVLLALDPPAVAIYSLDEARQGCVIWQP